MKILNHLSNEDYHAHHAVSKSVLDKIAISPLHCRAYLDGVRDEQTKAMQFGSALHSAVLEPAKFMNDYAVFEGDRRTTAGKQAYADLQARGAVIISADDNAVISAMAKAIREHRLAASLLREGIPEASVFWTDEATGLECKCRPDWWRTDSIIVDVKTTEDASPEAFARSVAAYRYHVQAAHYMAGTGAGAFLFIAVEKKAPYAVAVYELDSITLEYGEMIRRENLAAYHQCMKTGLWPGYSAEIETLSLPAWAFPKSESEEVEVEYV